MSNQNTPQKKNKVVKITLHSGANEYGSFNWEELVFTYEDGTEEIISNIATDATIPEDNSLSIIGHHDILKVIQALEINSKIQYEEKYHENSYGYLNS